MVTRMRGPRVIGVLFGAAGAGSFVAAGEAALERARREHAVDLAIEHWESTDPAWRVARLRTLAATGPDLVVLHGAQGEAPVGAVADAFPQVAFAVTQGRLVRANVASYEVSLEQPAFVAGALAAWSSRSGVVGHLSGERVGAGLRARAAFAAGVAHADPRTRFLSRFCGTQHDAALAERCALDQAGAGADVLFTMLGTGREGAIRACRRSGMRQIGDGAGWCESDPDVFIAAIRADAGWATAQAVADLAAGRLRVGEHVAVGLERSDVCGLVPAAEVGAALAGRLAALTESVACGEVAVPETWHGAEFGGNDP